MNRPAILPRRCTRRSSASGFRDPEPAPLVTDMSLQSPAILAYGLSLRGSDMRLLRVFTAAIGLAALLPTLSAAQGGRQFKDAWFWGVKGGGMLYSSASTENSAAPLVGADWLITRTRGGLYLSFEQAFLTTTGSFLDREPDSTFARNVALKNMRPFSVFGQAVASPAQQNFFLSNANGGQAFNFSLEGGIRYNFGSSIDR